MACMTKKPAKLRTTASKRFAEFRKGIVDVKNATFPIRSRITTFEGGQLLDKPTCLSDWILTEQIFWFAFAAVRPWKIRNTNVKNAVLCSRHGHLWTAEPKVNFVVWMNWSQYPSREKKSISYNVWASANDNFVLCLQTILNTYITRHFHLYLMA